LIEANAARSWDASHIFVSRKWQQMEAARKLRRTFEHAILSKVEVYDPGNLATV
jgi:hypothetical protein